MELNNALVQQSDLYCGSCNNFLNFPIVLFEELGNICGRCYKQEPRRDVRSIRNKSLESIIRVLEIPCRYKPEGCGKTAKYDEMVTHEETCTYRQYMCPSVTGCFWSGSLTNLLKHYEGFHPSDLLKSDSLVFEFDIDLSVSNFQSHKLLVWNLDTFLLQLRIENDNLWCAVCYIGNEDKGSSYEYLIEEIGYKASFYFRHDSKKAILSQNFMSMLDKDRAIHIETGPLKIYFKNASTITAKLKILGGDPVTELDESLLSHLECPVCNMYMLPPIHQCLTGHNICCKCRPKIGQCPTCRGRIENTRNYALESVSAKAKYPCINRMFGCYVVMPGSLIEKHELECTLRTYSCLIQNAACSWQGKHSDLLHHLKTVHKLSSSYQTKLTYHGNQFYMYSTNYEFLIAYDQVFKIGYKYENNSQTTFWNCRVIGSQNQNKYKFKIIYSNDLGDFMLVKSGLCLPYTADDEFFNHNLSFAQSISSKVGSTVKCEITKVN